ncbi:MAG: cytochrome c [Candidatus Baltobacteraceae bacterium]
MKFFLFGIVATLVMLGLIGYVGITQGLLVPANADARPGRLERWAASASLHATLAREVSSSPSPVAQNDENLEAGIKLYAVNCAACHGVADARPSTIGFGLYQRAPQLAKDGVEDDPPGVTYWKVKHGIRLTGMPSFGRTLDENQIWQIALFLKHMDSLPAGPQKLWKAAKNPVALVPTDQLPKETRK